MMLAAIVGVLAWVGPALGSLFTAGGAIMLARFRRSGRIATTDADKLWAAATEMRDELREEIKDLRDRLDTREDEIGSLRIQVDRLERDHQRCLEENARLMREAAALRERGAL